MLFTRRAKGALRDEAQGHRLVWDCTNRTHVCRLPAPRVAVKEAVWVAPCVVSTPCSLLVLREGAFARTPGYEYLREPSPGSENSGQTEVETCLANTQAWWGLSLGKGAPPRG